MRREISNSATRVPMGRRLLSVALTVPGSDGTGADAPGGAARVLGNWVTEAGGDSGGGKDFGETITVALLFASGAGALGKEIMRVASSLGSEAETVGWAALWSGPESAGV